MLMNKALAFWPLSTLLLVTDCATKRYAEEFLGPAGYPHEVIGNVVRFRLGYNEGAAMGMSLGPYSRVIFSVAALVAIVVLFRIYRAAPRSDWRTGVASGMMIAGAAGNLLDRLRSRNGVVDFIDIGVGGVRFWTFNVADIGVTLGAIGLAVLLWRQDALPASDTTDGPLPPGASHPA